jgi:ComF family protein
LISEPPFTHSIIPFPYSFPINRIIQGIKYKKERFWIKPFSHLFIEYLYTYQSNTPLPELLVAVPMHQKKLRQRGFNQAELLSNSMSKRLKIPTKTGALVKHKESINQASLGKEQRLKNLKGCFSIHDSACVEGKHIALVDDVMTTKATSELCSQLLIDAGAARVDIWSLARTTKNKSA